MQSLDGQTVALIGGAGFIGHHLALVLAQEGANVHIVDSLQVNNWLTFSSSQASVADPALSLMMLNQRLDLLRTAGIPLHIQDARDYSLLTRQLAAIKPDVIIQLAAVAHAGKSNKDPLSTFDHSLRTLENALDYARGMNVSRFVYFSSSMVYGNFNGRVITEDTICEPIGIYGALKFAGEKIVIAYQQVFNLPYTIVRPSALYGPRCVSRRVSQIFIENARSGLPITISGDGSEQLDFTYIDDLVDGVVRVLKHDQAKNEILNLTYGRARSVQELLSVVQQYYPTVQVDYQPKTEVLPERGTLSVEKAKHLIGYEPQYPLELGIPRYIAWYQALQGEPAHVEAKAS